MAVDQSKASQPGNGEKREVVPSEPVAFDRTRISDNFIGVVVVDEAIMGDYGPQWHYAVKPVYYTLGGNTGAYPCYVPTDKRGSRTKFGVVLTAFLDCFGDGAFKNIGAGEMIGVVGEFKRTMAKFGTDRATGEPIETEVVLPVRKGTDQEIADAGDIARNADSAPGGELAQATRAGRALTDTLSVDQISAVVHLLVGKRPGDVPALAARSKLATELKGGILNGTLIPALEAGGYLTLDETGVYRATESPEPPPEFAPSSTEAVEEATTPEGAPAVPVEEVQRG